MATLPEANEYPAGIYQLEASDPVIGGAPNEATKAGVDNIPHWQLAKRTNWLKIRVDTLVSKVIAATTLVAGIVRLSSDTDSTSETMAATPRAVKSAWDNAEARALKTTTIQTAGLADGGGTLAANRTINVPVATQAEAEEGTSSTKAMTPQRTTQNVIQRLSLRSVLTRGLATGGGTLAGDRTIDVPVATQAEAEEGLSNAKAMTPVRVLQSVIQRLSLRSIQATGLAQGGGTLAADRTIDVPVASQAEAEAGSINTKAMTPLRVRQAIIERLSGRTISTSGLAGGGGTLSADRTINVPVASQSEAQTGTDNSVAMTPLRVAQYVSALFTRSISGNGYITLPGGLIVQWIVTSVTAGNTSVTASLPITFPTTGRGAVATRMSAGSDAENTCATSIAQSTVTLHRSNAAGTIASYFIIAIGW